MLSPHKLFSYTLPHEPDAWLSYLKILYFWMKITSKTKPAIWQAELVEKSFLRHSERSEESQRMLYLQKILRSLRSSE